MIDAPEGSKFSCGTAAVAQNVVEAVIPLFD